MAVETVKSKSSPERHHREGAPGAAERARDTRRFPQNEVRAILGIHLVRHLRQYHSRKVPDIEGRGETPRLPEEGLPDAREAAPHLCDAGACLQVRLAVLPDCLDGCLRAPRVPHPTAAGGVEQGARGAGIVGRSRESPVGAASLTLGSTLGSLLPPRMAVA